MNQLPLFLSSGWKSIYLCVCLYKSLCHDSVTWIKKYKDDNLRPLSRTVTGLWLSLGLSVGERALQWLTERSRGSCFLLCEAGWALSALLSSSRRWGLWPCDSQYAGTSLTVQRTSSEEFMQHSHIHEDSPHQIQLLLWSISFISISFGLKTPKRKTANTKYCPEMQKCKILNHIIITKGLKCQVMQYKYIHRIATDTEIQQCNMFPLSADVCRRPAFTACKIIWTVTTSIPDPRGETFLCRVDVRRWKNSEKVN